MQMNLPSFRDLGQSFISLFFPDLCVACGEDPADSGSCFCLMCSVKLPQSNMYQESSNEFTERFWGRSPLVFGAARYHFTRKSPIQKAMHSLKYHNRPDIGVQIGREFGRKMRQVGSLGDLDGIVAVPLHPAKERLRGYNQSLQFANGLADTLEVPVLSGTLIRDTHTVSQTRKKRMDRFENVETVFTIKQGKALEGKHILLVDDILTTGATLEMCGNAILSLPNTRISMATIAIALKGGI